MVKKSFASFLVLSFIVCVFGASTFAQTPPRGAEFEDHSLIELVTANGQIGTVRVSNDENSLIVEPYLWSDLTKLIQYTSQ